jgi:phospholipid/cholesterol/gamma-HCH transport system ATP-binding protein
MTKAFIQFKDVKKSFGARQVLSRLNLSIYKGEILAVIGKSGTGKSVLLKHIIGLVHPDSGQIFIKGIPLNKMSRTQVQTFQRELSYMFQDNALFDFLNIYDNIALPLKENSKFPKNQIREKVMSRMEQLGLAGEEEKFPSQLSGGMRKRVALARALVTDPQVVLFDEPTTGLDPLRKKNVHSMIQEYQKKFGFTAVIVSHDIPEIFNIAQRIALLDKGVIQFEGSKQELMNSHSQILNDFISGNDSGE